MMQYIFCLIFTFCTIMVSAQKNLNAEDLLDVTFTKVDVEAIFPGGAEGWKNCKSLQKTTDHLYCSR